MRQLGQCPGPDLNDCQRPILGGMRVDVRLTTNTLSACTISHNAHSLFGGVVQTTDRFFLTNAHCTGTIGEVENKQAFQVYPDSLIGVEIVDPPAFANIDPSDPWGFIQCPPGGPGCRRSDVALFRYKEPYPNFMWEFLARTGHFSTTLGGDRRITDHFRFYLVPGLHTMTKVGRVTGTTEGELTHIDVDIPSPSGILMLSQMVGDFAAEEGDSGAPVFIVDEDISALYLVGIVWGGISEGTVFSNDFAAEAEIETAAGIDITACQACL